MDSDGLPLVGPNVDYTKVFELKLVTRIFREVSNKILGS